MMTKHFALREQATPPTEAIPMSGQVPNSGGGYGWKADKWTRLRRFLILGTEGGTYYASERASTIENAECVVECLQENPEKAINMAVDVSVRGLAPKNDAAIFVVALAMSPKIVADEVARENASRAVLSVCRTGTHLFTFVEMSSKLRGRGRLWRKAVRAWYAHKAAKGNLGYQLVKYQSRGKWSHRDVLRLAKPKPLTDSESMLYGWAVGKSDPWLGEALPDVSGHLKYPWLFNRAKTLPPEKAAEFVRSLGETNITWEMLPSEALARADVWEALLPNMPLGALIRNLGRMSANGLLVRGSQASKSVVAKLGDAQALRDARLHPLALYIAARQYQLGHGLRGKLTWSPVSDIVEAVDEAVLLRLGTLPEGGARVLVGLDVSSSMTYSGDIVRPIEAESLMAMCHARTGQADFVAFSHKLTPVEFSAKRSRVIDVGAKLLAMGFGSTDISAPIERALENKREYDAFVIYTDNEHNFGRRHPSQALEEYRRKVVPNARMALCTLVANTTTVADPNGPGMMDFVGLDASLPDVLGSFIAGEI